MALQAVQVKLEFGHKARMKTKVLDNGFTHDWSVFVRGPDGCDIQHFVDKVVFQLHDSFPKPRRVIKEPPYQVSESGYAGFIMPIEIYFKQRDEPKKICFEYDLILLMEEHQQTTIRLEKITIQNPSDEFREKLLKGGGVIVGGNDNTKGLPPPPVVLKPKPPPSTSPLTMQGERPTGPRLTESHALFETIDAAAKKSKPAKTVTEPHSSGKARIDTSPLSKSTDVSSRPKSLPIASKPAATKQEKLSPNAKVMTPDLADVLHSKPADSKAFNTTKDIKLIKTHNIDSDREDNRLHHKKAKHKKHKHKKTEHRRLLSDSDEEVQSKGVNQDNNTPASGVEVKEEGRPRNDKNRLVEVTVDQVKITENSVHAKLKDVPDKKVLESTHLNNNSDSSGIKFEISDVKTSDVEVAKLTEKRKIDTVLPSEFKKNSTSENMSNASQQKQMDKTDAKITKIEQSKLDKGKPHAFVESESIANSGCKDSKEKGISTQKEKEKNALKEDKHKGEKILPKKNENHAASTPKSNDSKDVQTVTNKSDTPKVKLSSNVETHSSSTKSNTIEQSINKNYLSTETARNNVPDLKQGKELKTNVSSNEKKFENTTPLKTTDKFSEKKNSRSSNDTEQPEKRSKVKYDNAEKSNTIIEKPLFLEKNDTTAKSNTLENKQRDVKPAANLKHTLVDKHELPSMKLNTDKKLTGDEPQRREQILKEREGSMELDNDDKKKKKKKKHKHNDEDREVDERKTKMIKVETPAHSSNEGSSVTREGSSEAELFEAEKETCSDSAMATTSKMASAADKKEELRFEEEGIQGSFPWQSIDSSLSDTKEYMQNLRGVLNSLPTELLSLDRTEEPSWRDVLLHPAIGCDSMQRQSSAWQTAQLTQSDLSSPEGMYNQLGGDLGGLPVNAPPLLNSASEFTNLLEAPSLAFWSSRDQPDSAAPMANVGYPQTLEYVDDGPSRVRGSAELNDIMHDFDSLAPNGERFSALVELQRAIMTSNDRTVLLRVIDLIKRTGLYKVSDNQMFDFDLCRLDLNTVNMLRNCVRSVL